MDFSGQMADANNRPTDVYHMWHGSAIMMRPGVRQSLIALAGHASPPTMHNEGVHTTPSFTFLQKKAIRSCTQAVALLPKVCT